MIWNRRRKSEIQNHGQYWSTIKVEVKRFLAARLRSTTPKLRWYSKADSFVVLEPQGFREIPSESSAKENSSSEELESLTVRRQGMSGARLTQVSGIPAVWISSNGYDDGDNHDNGEAEMKIALGNKHYWIQSFKVFMVLTCLRARRDSSTKEFGRKSEFQYSVKSIYCKLPGVKPKA